MLSSQPCHRHWLAHSSATIYLQPLQVGLYEDRECPILIGAGFFLHLMKDPRWTLGGLMTIGRVVGIMGRWAWQMIANGCTNVPQNGIKIVFLIPWKEHITAKILSAFIYLKLKFYAQQFERRWNISDCSMRKPPAMPRSPHIRMARWPKTPGELERYIGTESARTISQE